MKSISLVIIMSGLFLLTMLPAVSAAGEKVKVEKVRPIKGLNQAVRDGDKIKKVDKESVQSLSGVAKPKPKPKPEPKPKPKPEPDPDPCNDGSGTDPDCDNDEDEDRDVDTDGFDTPMTIEG